MECRSYNFQGSAKINLNYLNLSPPIHHYHYHSHRHHHHLHRVYYIAGRVITLPVDYYITGRLVQPVM